jgi:hypothetical protein
MQKALDRIFFEKERSLRKLWKERPTRWSDRIHPDGKESLVEWERRYEKAFDETFAEDKRLFSVFLKDQATLQKRITDEAKTFFEIQEWVEEGLEKDGSSPFMFKQWQKRTISRWVLLDLVSGLAFSKDSERKKQ